jgi:hypothetical protein
MRAYRVVLATQAETNIVRLVAGGVTMSNFRLRDQIPQWFDQLASIISPELAVCVFAITSVVILLVVGQILNLLFPVLWPKILKSFRTYMKWQVKQIFEWGRWHGLTQESVKYSVLCALAVSSAVGFWISLPIIRPRSAPCLWQNTRGIYLTARHVYFVKLAGVMTWSE